MLAFYKGSSELFIHCLRRTTKSVSSMSTPNKLAKLIPTIGTHNGVFHCDDVTACHMLKTLERFKDHEIVRTRDPKVLAQADIIVDVGDELNIETLRLDHHQRTFNQTINDYHKNIRTTNPRGGPRLSSAGLVYALFGKDYIVKQLSLGETYDQLNNDPEASKMVDRIYQKFYIEVIEEIDAVDNGVDIVEGENIQYNYRIKSAISNRVARLNPFESDASDEKRLEHFKKAMEMVGKEISEIVRYYGFIWWPKDKQLREFVQKRKEFDPSGHAVLVEGVSVSGYTTTIFEVEEEMGIVGELKYLVYLSPNGEMWRVLGVPVAPHSFKTRAPLKEEWRGKRDEDLQKISGVPDATFVHMSGFTGGAKSKEGIRAMINKSLGIQ